MVNRHFFENVKKTHVERHCFHFLMIYFYFYNEPVLYNIGQMDDCSVIDSWSET